MLSTANFTSCQPNRPEEYPLSKQQVQIPQLSTLNSQLKKVSGSSASAAASLSTGTHSNTSKNTSLTGRMSSLKRSTPSLSSVTSITYLAKSQALRHQPRQPMRAQLESSSSTCSAAASGSTKYSSHSAW